MPCCWLWLSLLCSDFEWHALKLLNRDCRLQINLYLRLHLMIQYINRFNIVARVIRNHNSTLWQPSDGTSREDWLRCHGFPCDKWQRTKEKITKLKYMVTSDGERTGVSEIPPDIDASDDSLDGCIWVTEEQIDDLMEELEANWKAEDGEQKIRKKRKLDDFSNSFFGLWDLPIAWKFDGSHDYQQREIIRGGFDHVEQQTCVRFKELGVNENSNNDHILITRQPTGCHSFIGHIGRRSQQLNLQDACIRTFGTIVHEIGHALGLWHEQQRADRDQHIRVRNGNIGSYAGQFVKQRTVSLGVPYDVGSVMHYDSYAGSSNGQRTMETLDPLEQSSLGQRTGMSFLDAKIINLAYCGGVCRDDLRRPCLHGGYQDPNDCSRCRCPDGFSGTFCEALAPSNANCGAEIRLTNDGSEEFISSPNYASDGSGSYDNHDECNWRVTVPNGYHVQIEFVEKFSVYCHYASQCNHWVEVKYNQETLDEGHPGARFCCYSRPTVVLTSEDEEMVITLRANWTSTSSYYRSGFQARLVAVKDPFITRGFSTTVSSTTVSTTATKASTQPSTTLPTTVRPSMSPGCEDMDLVFVLDSSGSVMEANWRKVLQFVQDILKYLPIHQNKVRVGLVSFGNGATTHIYLDDHSEEMLLAMNIEMIAFKNQWTNTGAGLRMGRRVFERSPRNVNKVIVLITDGESNRDADRTLTEAALTRDVGIEVIALAIGNQANLKEAEDITGKSENVVIFENFDSLKSTYGTMKVLNHVCSDHMMGNPNTTGDPEWSCSFEDNQDALCGIDQDKNDVFDWTRWTGATPSQQTGPSKAHDGSYYLYIEASRPRKYGDTAKLLLPATTKSGTKCMQFHYNMHGFHVNSLEVFSLTSDGKQSLIWKRFGDIDDTWREGSVKIALSEGDRLVLVGTVGMEFSGDIAVDDLQVLAGTCPV